MTSSTRRFRNLQTARGIAERQALFNRESLAEERRLIEERRAMVTAWRKDNADIVTYFAEHRGEDFTGWMAVAGSAVRNGGLLSVELTERVRAAIR